MLPSILEIRSSIDRGENSPTDFVERCLEQIGRFEPDLQAWVVVDADGARQQAATLAEAPLRGPLHGVPVGIKDIIDVVGLPTRCGSGLTSDQPAQADAPVVAALRAAGAIILGKTVTTEWACFDPAATRNPWNLLHTPGGSSSGSAVAVASGMCAAALGTQTGGSITRPATYCGVAGMKPTFGSLDMQYITPVSRQLDHVGPIARSVADLAQLWSALKKTPIAADGTHDPPRLGVLVGGFVEQADDGIRQMFQVSLDLLAAHGVDCRLIDVPSCFDVVHEMHYRIMSFEAAAVHRVRFQQFRDQFGTSIVKLIQDGLATSTDSYADARRHQATMRAAAGELFDGVDALVMPATNTTAPANLGTTGDSRFNSPWSFVGLPTVSFPSGLDSQGLPAGLQLVGKSNREDTLLRVAAWCEAAVGFRERPALCRV